MYLMKINKDKIDLDVTIIDIKLFLKGNRNMITINCTATQATEFVDYLNENRGVIRNKHDKEKMENKFYIFDDLLKKKNVMVSLNDVKYMEIPFFIDDGKEYDLQVLRIN